MKACSRCKKLRDGTDERGPGVDDLLLGSSQVEFGCVLYQEHDRLGGDASPRRVDMGSQHVFESDPLVVEHSIGRGGLGVAIASGGNTRRRKGSQSIQHDAEPGRSIASLVSSNAAVCISSLTQDAIIGPVRQAGRSLAPVCQIYRIVIRSPQSAQDQCRRCVEQRGGDPWAGETATSKSLRQLYG